MPLTHHQYIFVNFVKHFLNIGIFFEKFWSIASNRVHIYKYLFKPASINPFETEV
jgi:hypothetical protein